MVWRLTLVAVLLAPETADACSIPNNEAFVLDAAYADDHVAPGTVTITNAILSRAGDYEGCGARMRSSCSDLGTISFSVHAEDDRAPSDRLGVVVSVLEGELPQLSLGAPFSPLRTMSGSVVYVFGDSDPQDYDFVLEVRAIDLNGNVGPPTLVPFSRGTDGGCATGRPHGMVALVVLVLLLSLRRGRRRQVPGALRSALELSEIDASVPRRD